MKFLLSALAASFLFLSGCATTSTSKAANEPAEPTTSETATETASAELKTPGTSAVGDKTTCPVSNEEFVVEADTATFEYKGKTFHVCCPDCLDSLKADPEKYLGKYVN